MTDVERKEIAQAYRIAAKRLKEDNFMVSPGQLERWAKELDPPRPEPGTVIQFASGDYGIVTKVGVFCWHIDVFEELKWEDLIIKWWSARFAGPMQEIVDIPSVKDWPGKCDEVTLRWSYDDHDFMSDYAGVTITRAEALRMEETND